MFYKHLGALKAHKYLWQSQKECFPGYRLTGRCNTRVILNVKKGRGKLIPETNIFIHSTFEPGRPRACHVASLPKARSTMA